MNKHIVNIIYWGSLWGITESTLGYLLHLAAVAIPGLPGLIMFPVAFYFMRRAFLTTGQPITIMYTSSVAAAIKLIDFLVPGSTPILIVNPALAILMEGLAVALVMAYSQAKKTEPGYAHSFSMGVLWRGIFLGYMFIISLFNLPAGLVTSGLPVSLRFLLLESLVNAVLMYGYLMVAKTDLVFDGRPKHAYTALWAAIILQIVL